MRPGDAEYWARWAGSLAVTIREAEAQLARPLRSPVLRCLCAGVQMVRLAGVARQGLRIAVAGLSLAHHTARAGHLREAFQISRGVYLTARTVSHAGGVFLRAGGRASWEGWAAWSAGRAQTQPAPLVRFHRMLQLGRAALAAVGGHDHDRR